MYLHLHESLLLAKCGQHEEFSALDTTIAADFSTLIATNSIFTLDSIYAIALLVTNRKSHMGFPFTPRSMTLDDLELL